MRKSLRLISLRFRRNRLTILAIAGVATTFSGLWWQYDVLSIQDDERGAYDDGLSKFTGNPEKPFAWAPGGQVTRSKDIVIVAIDDKTFADINQHEPWRQRYGSFPYDRVLWADAFSYLKKAGAKAIVFDAVMDESKSDISGDIALGQQVVTDGIPLYLGFTTVSGVEPLPKEESPVNRPIPAPTPPAAKAPAGDEAPMEDFPEEPTPEEAKKAKAAALTALRAKASKAFSFPVVATGVEIPTFAAVKDAEPGKEAQYPIPAIEQVIDVVAGFGTVDHEPDEDGKMRITRFVYTDGINNYVTLPVAVAADYFGAEKVEISPGKLKLGKKVIPINPEGDAELDYAGTLFKRFDTVSVSDVLRYASGAAGGEARFKDKFVFVAGFAIGTGDSKSTPLETSTPAVVKQAVILQNLLDGRFIIRAPFWVSLLFALFIALISASLVLVVRNSFIDIGWPVLLYVGFFMITGGFLVATKVHVLSALPGLAGTLASILATTWERVFAGKERERVKNLFQNYMEKELVDVMIEQKELPKLGGENVEVTAFFSDIKGFSTFSEKYRDQPQVVMSLLNRYLGVVTPLLKTEGAIIDKYIGDAVVALFGAPVSFKDHALRACRGALKVQKAIGILREELRKEGLPDVYTRVGINTAVMLVGNIGTPDLLDYTGLGDGMNLAARLEAANKVFGTLTMIGPGTYAVVRDHVEARELDRVRLPGKQQWVAVYELLGMKGELHFDKAKVIDLYGQALLLYRARKFDDAGRKLVEALQVDQSDGPSQRLLGKCKAFLAAPPPPEWEGISELEK